MRTIYKYPLAIVDNAQSIRAPAEARVVHVDNQNERPTLWMEVDDSRPNERRTFVVVVGTGAPVPAEPAAHVGTVLTAGGGYVWHVYEVEL